MGYKFTPADDAALRDTLDSVQYVSAPMTEINAGEMDFSDPDFSLDSLIEAARQTPPGTPEFDAVVAASRAYVGLLLEDDPSNERLKAADDLLEQLQVTNWDTEKRMDDLDTGSGLTTQNIVSLVASTFAVDENDCGCDGSYSPKSGRTYDMAEVVGADAPTEDLSDKWSGILGIEGELTGDGRYIQPEALRWEGLPIPLRYVLADVGAHSGAIVVGNIETVERLSVADANVRLAELGRDPMEEIEGVFVIWGTGVFDLGSEHAREAARVVQKKFMNGVSMDLDDVAFEVRVASDAPALMTVDPAELARTGTPDEDGRVKVQEMAPDDEVMVTTDARMRAATIVAVPAFNRAHIHSLVASAAPETFSITLTIGGATFDVEYPAFPWAHEEFNPTSQPDHAFNWVDDVGGLPKYIKRISDAIQKKGKAEGHAIAIAVNAVKKMCATGDINFPGKQDVNAGSRAEACAAAAEWEEKKARANADSATTDSFMVKGGDLDKGGVNDGGKSSAKAEAVAEQVRVPEGNPGGGQWKDTPKSTGDAVAVALDETEFKDEKVRADWEKKRGSLRDDLSKAAKALDGLKIGSPEYEKATKALLDVLDRAEGEVKGMHDASKDDVDKKVAQGLLDALGDGKGALAEYLRTDWTMLDDANDIGKGDRDITQDKGPTKKADKMSTMQTLKADGWNPVKQLRVPKGNGRRSGRWVDMPGTVMDRLQREVEMIENNVPGKGLGNAEVEQALDDAFDGAGEMEATNKSPKDKAFKTQVKSIISSLDDAMKAIGEGPDSEARVGEPLQPLLDSIGKAAFALEEFNDLDLSLLDEETDIGAGEDEGFGDLPGEGLPAGWKTEQLPDGNTRVVDADGGWHGDYTDPAAAVSAAQARASSGEAPFEPIDGTGGFMDEEIGVDIPESRQSKIDRLVQDGYDPGEMQDAPDADLDRLLETVGDESDGNGPVGGGGANGLGPGGNPDAPVPNQIDIGADREEILMNAVENAFGPGEAEKLDAAMTAGDKAAVIDMLYDLVEQGSSAAMEDAGTSLAEVRALIMQLEQDGEFALKAAAPPHDPDAPSVKHFSNPNLKGPTALTVDKDGRVYGHLATWGTCHLSHTAPGKCVTPPKSRSGYAYFQTGSVMTAEGAEIAVGQITLNTRHAKDNLKAAATLAHYDNTGTAVADVVAGEDAHGIWFSGSLRPGVKPESVRTLRASPLSGDWRRIAGGLELVAALAVNVPGFPVPRPKGLVASGEMQTLVAAGMLPPRKVRRPGTEGALSADDLKYLKSLAARERREEQERKLAVLDSAAQMASRLRSTEHDETLARAHALATKMRVQQMAARLRTS